MCGGVCVWWGVFCLFSFTVQGIWWPFQHGLYVFLCWEISLCYFSDNFLSKVFLCPLLLESSGLILLLFRSIFKEGDLTSAFIFLIFKFSFLFHWCSFLLWCHRCAISSRENIHYVLKLFLALCIVSASFGFFFFPPIYLSFMREISSNIWRILAICLYFRVQH